MPITSLTGLISDTVLSLPAEDVQRGCGVALDIGSTIGKILYRSNKEYKNGKPINQDDATRSQVHCAMFPRADVTGIISYIKDSCDLVTNASGEVVVMSAGNGGAAFRLQIEAALDCKMILLPEFDCFCKAFLAVEKTTQAEELFMSLSPENQALVDVETADHKAHFKETMEKMQLKSQMTFGSMDTGRQELKEEDRPRLMLMAGSGSVMMQINSDGTFGILDGVSAGGRYMHGLACFLTGENDFEKLVEMAESSDLLGDPSTAGPKDNFYETAARTKQEAQRRFPFGKGITTPIDKAKKGDLAFSVFNTTAEINAQLISTSVCLSRAKEVYVCGNVFNTEFMRLLLCRIKARMVLPLNGQYELKFVRSGGMYGALGAFLSTE